MKLLQRLFGHLKKKPARFILTMIILVLAVHIAIVAYYVYYDRNNMPDIETLVAFEPPAIGTIYDTGGRTIINLALEFRWIVRPEEIPNIVKQGFLSAEDKHFYGHNGISWMDVGRASWINIGHIAERLLAGKGLDLTPQQGASTIDQQLARLFFLTEKTRIENSNQLIYDNYFTRLGAFITRDVSTVNKTWRKIEEARLAFWINEEFSKPERFGARRAKEEILARYLSYTYFRYVYGIRAAVKLYYDKNLEDLTYDDADKAAFLAGVIKNPLLYAPAIDQKKDVSKSVYIRQINRRNAILDQMAENGYVSEEQAAMFKERDIPIPTKDIRNHTEAPSVVGDVLTENRKYGFTTDKILNGDLQIYTTVNVDIQKIAQKACENGLTEYEKRHPEHKGQAQCSAIVLRNLNGAILAEVGGRQWYQNRVYRYSDLNRVNRLRPAGSAFKPIVYLTAFRKENGWKPNDIISDSPIGLSMGYGRGYHWIDNYDGKFLGDITLCEALYRSRNAATVRLVKDYLGTGSFEASGMKKVIDTARLIGIKSPFHNALDHMNRTVYYPTSALGASEITVIELANAYREIASGVSAEPYIIKRIMARNGDVLFEKHDTIEPSKIDPEALDMLRLCLRRVVTQPGGTAYSLTLENFPVPIAGKTGTTDDFRNALFAGWTHGLEGTTVVARIDFDDNRELGSKETGARTALPIVKEIFLKIYEQNLVGPVPKFPEEIENPIYNPAFN